MAHCGHEPSAVLTTKSLRQMVRAAASVEALPFDEVREEEDLPR